MPRKKSPTTRPPKRDASSKKKAAGSDDETLASSASESEAIEGAEGASDEAGQGGLFDRPLRERSDAETPDEAEADEGLVASVSLEGDDSEEALAESLDVTASEELVMPLVDPLDDAATSPIAEVLAAVAAESADDASRANDAASDTDTASADEHSVSADVEALLGSETAAAASADGSAPAESVEASAEVGGEPSADHPGPARSAPRSVSELHLRGIIESLVFVSDKPITAGDIAKVARADVRDVRRLLEELKEDYRDRGVHLDELGGGWQFRSSAVNAPFVREMLQAKPVRLTRAQVETLAILAYRQPITRPEVDDIRGVDSGSALKVLLDRDLIRILGRKEEAGRPVLYGTSGYFLEFFGLKSLRDLPTLREFTELTPESEATLVRELGADGTVAGPGAVGEEAAPEEAASTDVAGEAESSDSTEAPASDAESVAPESDTVVEFEDAPSVAAERPDDETAASEDVDRAGEDVADEVIPESHGNESAPDVADSDAAATEDSVAAGDVESDASDADADEAEHESDAAEPESVDARAGDFAVDEIERDLAGDDVPSESFDPREPPTPVSDEASDADASASEASDEIADDSAGDEPVERDLAGDDVPADDIDPTADDDGSHSS